MSRVLASFLDKPEMHITNIVNKLEHKTGYNSTDVRLLADNATAVRSKITGLGLDPDDTTGEELYYTLLAKFETDSKLIDKTLGVAVDASLLDKIEKAEQFIDHMEGLGETWLIKQRKLREIIAANLPPKTMKLLGYRSADSMLKHEDIYELTFGASFIESNSWQKSFAAKISKLSSADYELKPIKQVVLSRDKWKPIKSSQAFVANKQLGIVALVEAKIKPNVSTLALALMLHDAKSQIAKKGKASKLGHMHPALHWWEEAEHLMSWNDGEPVSLNFRDLAHAHIHQHQYHERQKQHASNAFWLELINRYKEKLDEIPQEIAEAETEVVDQARRAMVPNADMAAEMEEAEA